MKNNPLTNEIDLPGISVTLPTGGKFYDQGVLKSGANPEDLMVGPFSMWDEVNWRNPYSIMSGDAIRKLLTRVTPDIERPDGLCAVDVDTILLAARQASYGNTMEMEIVCTNDECKKTGQIAVRLDNVMLQYQSLLPAEQWQVTFENGQVAQIRPILYSEVIDMLKMAIQTEKETKRIDINDDDKQELMVDRMINTQVSLMRTSIAWVKSKSGEIYHDQDIINDWLDNIPVTWVEELREKTRLINELNGEAGSVEYECPHCGHKQMVNVIADPTRFFGSASVD